MVVHGQLTWVTLLQSEGPILYTILAFLSAIGLMNQSSLQGGGSNDFNFDMLHGKK